LLGKNSLRSNSFPHCHSIPLKLFNVKYLRPVNKNQIKANSKAVNYEPNKDIKYEPNKDGKYEPNKEGYKKTPAA
jgi:hypothetical protein